MHGTAAGLWREHYCPNRKVSRSQLQPAVACARVACGCGSSLLQAMEQVEASTKMKLLRKYKLLQVQYKGVDAETRCVLIAPDSMQLS